MEYMSYKNQDLYSLFHYMPYTKLVEDSKQHDIYLDLLVEVIFDKNCPSLFRTLMWGTCVEIRTVKL